MDTKIKRRPRSRFDSLSAAGRQATRESAMTIAEMGLRKGHREPHVPGTTEGTHNALQTPAGRQTPAPANTGGARELINRVALGRLKRKGVSAPRALFRPSGRKRA